MADTKILLIKVWILTGFKTGGYNFVVMKNNRIIKTRKFVISG